MRTRDPISNSQAEFVHKLFEKRMRLDKRGWKEFRPMEVTYDRETGVALAILGDTRIMCSVETEVSAPRKSARPGAGSIQFSMELLPMAHPAATESALDTETEECLTMLETLYRDSFCIDFDTLCIETNQYVFDLKCILKVLDYDGGLFDCATIAVTSALMGFKRNDVTYNSATKKLTIHSPSEKPMIPLTMIYKPATVTFGFVKDIDDPILDPTECECTRMDGYLTIGANGRGEICLIYQNGRLSITPEKIAQCTEFAIMYVKTIIDKMAHAVYGRSDNIIQ